MPAAVSLKKQLVVCGVCRSSEYRHYTSGKDFEYDTSSETFKMVECLHCQNIYLNPRPIRDELAVIYPPNYYAYNYHQAINPLALKAKDFLDSSKTRRWLSFISTNQPRFLDIGCGDGRYLRRLHAMGIAKDNLYGVELDQEQINRLNAEGFHGYCGRIEEIADRLPAEFFDIIIILQVLEHVENPAALMQYLSRQLAPDGILVIETPNTRSLDAQIFRNTYWGGYHFPRHWNLFCPVTMETLLRQTGMQVKSIKYLPSPTFWIYSFHHIVKDWLKMPRLAKLLDPFQNLFLLCLFTGFDLIRAKLGFMTSNIQVVGQKAKTLVDKQKT